MTPITTTTKRAEHAALCDLIQNAKILAETIRDDMHDLPPEKQSFVKSVLAQFDWSWREYGQASAERSDALSKRLRKGGERRKMKGK